MRLHHWGFTTESSALLGQKAGSVLKLGGQELVYLHKTYTRTAAAVKNRSALEWEQGEGAGGRRRSSVLQGQEKVAGAFRNRSKGRRGDQKQ